MNEESTIPWRNKNKINFIFHLQTNSFSFLWSWGSLMVRLVTSSLGHIFDDKVPETNQKREPHKEYEN